MPRIKFLAAGRLARKRTALVIESNCSTYYTNILDATPRTPPIFHTVIMAKRVTVVVVALYMQVFSIVRCAVKAG